MKIPKLVVLTGYPTCGKSTVSKFLAEDLGFTRLSGDDISIELFGHTYPYKGCEDPERIWEAIYQRRDALLKSGKDVVVDTSAYSENRRKYLFSTPLESDRYLVWLQVNPETMNKRQESRKWMIDSIYRWKNDVGWEDPRQNGYKFLAYQNNFPEDLEQAKADLRKQLH
jgi:predicted kinase